MRFFKFFPFFISVSFGWWFSTFRKNRISRTNIANEILLFQQLDAIISIFRSFFLTFGFSVENISRIIIFLSTLCFALSAFIIVYRFTSNKYLALLISILMLVLEKNFGDTDYPSLIFSNHSFGMLSLAVSSLIFSLILNKNYKSSSFFSVLLISIHPIVGLWILSVLIFSMILLKNKKINLDLFKGAIFGSIITILSFIFF